MTWVAVGTAAATIAIGAAKDANKNRKIKNLEKKAPKYSIQEEAYQNQALAKNMAFGRDRGIQQAEQNIETQSADAIGQAQQVSNSSNAILDTIAGITGGANNSLRNLGIDEANIQSSRMRDLYGANNAMIDEQDKKWNYNENMPYQNKLAALRDQKKANAEATFKMLDTAGSIYASGQSGKSGKSS